MVDFKSEFRFRNIQPFKDKVWLSSPTMHGEELTYMEKAYHTNWMITAGANIDSLEQLESD